jgi:hypothetical protein
VADNLKGGGLLGLFEGERILALTLGLLTTFSEMGVLAVLGGRESGRAVGAILLFTAREDVVSVTRGILGFGLLGGCGDTEALANLARADPWFRNVDGLVGVGFGVDDLEEVGVTVGAGEELVFGGAILVGAADVLLAGIVGDRAAFFHGGLGLRGMGFAIRETDCREDTEAAGCVADSVCAVIAGIGGGGRDGGGAVADLESLAGFGVMGGGVLPGNVFTNDWDELREFRFKAEDAETVTFRRGGLKGSVFEAAFF